MLLKQSRAYAEQELTELLAQGHLNIALLTEAAELRRKNKLTQTTYKETMQAYGNVLTNWVEVVARSLEAIFPTVLEAYQFKNTQPTGLPPGNLPFTAEARARAFVAELESILRNSLTRYLEPQSPAPSPPSANAEKPVKPFPSALLMTLQNTLAVIYWARRDFQTFLETTVPVPEVLATLNYADSKRNTSAALIRALATDQPRYGAQLEHLMGEICAMEEFPHLDHSDPTGNMTKTARAAVEQLRKAVEKWTGEPPRSGLPKVEPAVSEGDYEKILKQLRAMSNVMERSPASFRTLGEEEIRDHLLMSLNSLYPGQATGETFNKAGKTDILVRVEDRNTFIAECKIWTGPAAFNAAIDQLLSYLTWRDCKCALLVFNRNKDTHSVETKMHETITKRVEHQETLSNVSGEGGRYVLAKTIEPNKAITVATMLFDISDK